jgi:hypothetical protein
MPAFRHDDVLSRAEAYTVRFDGTRFTSRVVKRRGDPKENQMRIKLVAVLGISVLATSAFADQGQAGWACYTKNVTAGHTEEGGRWYDPNPQKAARDGVWACEAGGRYHCILVKCVPAGSRDDHP